MVVVRKPVAVLRKEKSEKVVEEPEQELAENNRRCLNPDARWRHLHLFYTVIQDHMLCISKWISTMFRMHRTALT